MIKYVNLKQIGCLICIAVLLAGCDSSQQVSHAWRSTVFDNDLIVEGMTYRATSTYGRMKDGSLQYSFTVIFPDGQHYFPAIRYVDGEIKEKGEIYLEDGGGTKKMVYYDETRPLSGQIKVADVPFHVVYFIDDGKIVFQKSYVELGFEVPDAQSPIADSRRLQPILEKLIRENVPPQKHEME